MQYNPDNYIKRTMIDLFAGAGGLSCGLEQAGFTPVLAIEKEQRFARTYQINHPNVNVIADDIQNVDEKAIHEFVRKYGEIDLIAGGPPCQGFSVNAPIRSLDDPRNHLFEDFLRITSEILPKAVLIENVPGIISLGKGTVVEQIRKALNGMGYNVDYKILFAGHYGVPQLRFRTIIIGVRNYSGSIVFPSPKYYATATANFQKSKELCFSLSPKDAAFLKPKVTVWDAIGDMPEISGGEKISEYDYLQPAQGEYQRLLRDGSSRITSHWCSRLSEINKERLKYIPIGGSWRDIPVDLLPKGLRRARRSDHTKRYGRLDPNSLCSTIMTKCDPHWGSFFHPTQARPISVREAARIQSFPDSYQFSGNMTEQYEQVGNAVPPLLARAVGECINEMIGERDMAIQRPKNDIVEIFGYAPDDTTKECRSLWALGGCPFVAAPCSKTNHDKTVVYGTCSVTTMFGDCIICPNRLYANHYATLKRVSLDAFGDLPFYTYPEFISHRSDPSPCIVALGMHSGHEIKLGQSCSMDWVLAKIKNSTLLEYTGIEVQSIDITNNYRDNWYAYKHIETSTVIPRSLHGMNWANVHKRLIPQIIRKSLIYSRSALVHHGLYFIVPDIVYKKFEDIIGADIPLVTESAPDVITVHTYALGDHVPEAHIRDLVPVRQLRFKMQDFSDRFITGPNLPAAEELDSAVRNALGLR